MTSKKAVAYLIESDCDEGCVIVFAKTREQARNIALLTGEFDNSKYIELHAYRRPHMDKYHKRGKKLMDFSDPADRLALVRDEGFYCLDIEPNDCAKCNAKNFCDKWAKDF